MAENPNDTTEVREAKDKQVGPYAPGADPALLPAPHETLADAAARAAARRTHETQAQADARVRAGVPVAGPVITSDSHPAPGPVTLHLMDADEKTAHNHIQVRVRPKIVDSGGYKYECVREQADGSFVYKQIP